jgi:hypothetical protein
MFGAKLLNFMHQEFLTIQALLHYALETPGHQGKGIYIVGPVNDKLASQISSSTGLQVAGYRITIDHSALIHTLRQHGQAMEVLRGQLVVTEADLLELANWLAAPMLVADAGQHKGQLQCLRFEIATSTARLVAIMEVRTRKDRQQLALKTLYKKRPAA